MQNKTAGRLSLGTDTAMAFMIGCLLIGVLLGTLSYCFMPHELTDKLAEAGREHIAFRQTSDLGHILIDSFFTASLFIAAEGLLGFFAFGQIPALLLPVFRGIGLGTVLSMVYNTYGSPGAVYASIIIIPSAIISGIALCMAAKESARFSSRLFVITMSSDPCRGISEMTKLYCVRLLSAEAAVAASAAADCIFSLIFAAKI